MKQIYKYLIFLSVVAVVGVVFYNKVYIPKITYKTTNPTRGELEVKVFGIGNVGAKSIYAVTSGVSAKVLSVNTDEGLWVKKGDLIATLDSVDLPTKLQESKIVVEKSRSELNALKEDLKSLKAQKTLALVTYNRYSKLKKQSFASQSEYDKAKADLDVIKAQMKATLARMKSAKISIKLSQESVKALEEQLARFKVYAPVDGYVISKDTEVAKSISPTSPIVTIVSPKDVWIKAYIDERISTDISVGDKADITLRSNDKHIYKGIVKRIVAQSDAITQEREIDVAFNNLPIPFYINEQAEVLVHTKTLKDVIKVPSNAINYQNKKAGIWINNKGIAHFQEVEILAITDDETALKGLDITKKVILTSQKNKPLSEGMKVH